MSFEPRRPRGVLSSMAKPDRFSSSSAEQKKELDLLEEEIEGMRMMYQRYFNGVDNIPPARDHAQLKKKVNLLMNRSFRTSQLRFRFQGMRARLITYEQHWRRILHQIEKGTFKRVLAEARLREFKIRKGRAHELAPLRGQTIEDLASAQGSTGFESLADLLDEAAAAVDAVASKREREDSASTPAAASKAEPQAPAPPTLGAKPKGPPPRPRPASTSSKPQLPAGMDAKTARKLFKEFVAAKKAAGQSTQGITYGALVKKLARDVPKLKQRYGEARKIEFEVASDGGRVRLRAKT